MKETKLKKAYEEYLESRRQLQHVFLKHAVLKDNFAKMLMKAGHGEMVKIHIDPIIYDNLVDAYFK